MTETTIPPAAPAAQENPASRAWKLWQRLKEKEQILAAHAIASGGDGSDLRAADLHVREVMGESVYGDGAFRVRDFITAWAEVKC